MNLVNECTNRELEFFCRSDNRDRLAFKNSNMIPQIIKEGSKVVRYWQKVFYTFSLANRSLKLAVAVFCEGYTLSFRRPIPITFHSDKGECYKLRLDIFPKGRNGEVSRTRREYYIVWDTSRRILQKYAKTSGVQTEEEVLKIYMFKKHNTSIFEFSSSYLCKYVFCHYFVEIWRWFLWKTKQL